MHEIDAENAAAYLARVGLIAAGEPASIRILDGGVSNMVLRVERADPAQADFVVKQARRQLRTRQPWFSPLERIWREIEVLQVCQTLLEREPKRGQNDLLNSSDPFIPAIGIPRVLYVDRENYLFAMTAADATEVWKTQLLAGRPIRRSPWPADVCWRRCTASRGAIRRWRQRWETGRCSMSCTSTPTIARSSWPIRHCEPNWSG